MPPHEDRALPGMTSCATHHRRFPHPCVGWLTPHRMTGFALVPARCDRGCKGCGDALVESIFTLEASPATGAGSR